MADSMLMSRDEIAAADASLEPSDSKPAPKARDRAEKEPEPEIEYVGPEDDGEDDAEPGDAKDKPAKAEKPGDKGKKEEKPKPPEGFVDRNAFVAEREARKREKAEWEARERAREEKLNFLAGQIAQVNQERQQAAQPQTDAPEPKWEDDPRAYTEYHLNRARTENEQLRAYLSQQHQHATVQAQQQEYTRYYTNAITASEQQVAQEVPDYFPAVTALRNARGHELSQMPQFRGNPQAVEDQLNREAIAIAEQAVRSGEPPAVVYYRLAMARGWRPEMAQQQAPAERKQADAAASKSRDAAAEIEQLSKAKEAAEGLSHSGGSAPASNRMSLESLDRMSNKQIQDWVRRVSKNDPNAVDAALAKMMGVAR